MKGERFAIVNMVTGEIRWFRRRVRNQHHRHTREIDERTAIESLAPGHQYDAHVEEGEQVYTYAGDWRTLTAEETKST